ncbi:hypothetical protein_gp203 [Bacillus phage vB_BceM_WH1]|nr:hypothetical protein_gp203 [Bacillus phage vB_BceM_WH1]
MLTKVEAPTHKLELDLPLIDRTVQLAKQTCPHCDNVIGEGIFIDTIDEKDMVAKGDIHQCPNCIEFYAVIDKPVFPQGIDTVWTKVKVKK